MVLLSLSLTLPLSHDIIHVPAHLLWCLGALVSVELCACVCVRVCVRVCVCVCMCVFVACRYDNTVCVWGEDFNLIREINLTRVFQVRPRPHMPVSVQECLCMLACV